MTELQSPERPTFFLRKLQSHTRYEFRDDEAEAIISALTWDWRDNYFAPVATEFNAQEQEAIRVSIAVPFSRPSTAGNGLLDTLPDTIFQDIVLLSDLRTVFKLRQVSLRSREVIDSVWQFQRLTKHGLTLYRITLVNEVACSINLVDAYELLLKRTCKVCGDCTEHDIRSQCLLLREINGFLYDLPATKAQQAQFQVFKCINRCNVYGGKTTGFEQLVSAEQVKSVLGWRQSPRIRVFDGPPGSSLTWMTICKLPVLDREGNPDDYRVKCSGCKKTSPPDGRSRRTREEEWVIYDRESFLEHFRWCKEAQRIWQRKSESGDALQGNGYTGTMI
ncbi:hypothetical protein FGRMN_5673 [Fusarium graminum]|nr:hypothetical protein FGRMN_5673 [Fusarium graminum]